MTTSSFECAYPIAQYPFITAAHGAGGQLTQQLLQTIFWPAFHNPLLAQQHDGAFIQLPSQRIAMSTDSYVVSPLFFPGSDIGELAVTGTLNDLAMCGAKPLYLTAGFILTEGLPTETLIRVVDSMRQTAANNQVQIVAGDIKVVEKTKDLSLYINTTGVGCVAEKTKICPQNIQLHDAIIVSGDIGRHGLAVLAARGQLAFEPPIESDCTPLWPMIEKLMGASISLHCARDLTRGGLAGALIELSETVHFNFTIEESALPVSQPVHTGCELLGLDVLHVANEGRMVLFVPQAEVATTLAILRTFKEGQDAAVIGQVDGPSSPGQVVLKNSFGSARRLNLFSGEQLPRIC